MNETSDDYATRLADWKRKQGIPDHAHAMPATEQLMVSEDSRNRKQGYCMLCGNEFRVCDMRLITRSIDPYMQISEAEGDYISADDRVHACKPCFEEKYEDEPK